MKKLLFSLIALPLLVLLGSCVPVARPEPDYREMVIRAAMEADPEAGREARGFWAGQLAVQRSSLPCPDFDELLLLSRFIQAEAGDARLPEEWRLCVGEAALNRVASPEYPDTLAEVLEQAGPYLRIRPEALGGELRPSRACVLAALRLLQGERRLEPTVVFLSRCRLGGGVYATLCDRLLGRYYLCRSEHPELYTEAENAACGSGAQMLQ